MIKTHARRTILSHVVVTAIASGLLLALVDARAGAPLSGLQFAVVAAAVAGGQAFASWYAASVRIGQQVIRFNPTALPLLVAVHWLPPMAAVVAILAGTALAQSLNRDWLKGLVNVAMSSRSAVLLVVVVATLEQPFGTRGVMVTLAAFGVLTLVDVLEVRRFVVLVAPDAPRPGRHELVMAMGVDLMVAAVAITVVAIVAGMTASPLLAAAPLVLLGLSLWSFDTYTRIHDAQRHLLAVTRRLFTAKDATQVVAIALDGIHTVLPVGAAAVVVERADRDTGGLDVWRAAAGSDGAAVVTSHGGAEGVDHVLTRSLQRLHRGQGVARLRSSADVLPAGTTGPRLAAPFTLEDGTRALLVAAGEDGGRRIDREGNRELLHSLALQLGSALSRVRLDDALHVAEAERAHSAAHDDLTGLPNRATWSQATDVLLSGNRRDDGRVAVLVFDVSGFSRCNDTLGHEAGDEALVEVARRLDGQLREPDVLARLGTDVFGITLGDAEDLDQVVAVCDRLLGTFDAPFELAGLRISLQARVGIAMAPDHGDHAAVLLQHAELALATAKQERTAWSLHLDTDHDARRRRLVLRGGLRAAIARDGLHVQLQPKVAAADGAVVGFEALARWHDDELGQVSPAEFVPEVEELGLMPALTCSVLRQAMDLLVELRAVDEDVTIAVNVSASAVTDANVLGTVRDGLAERGLPGSSLLLELTESAVAGRGVVAALRDLEVAGVQVSVDDYGTGWSSLSRLLELKVDELKIDRSFVAAMVQDADAAAIVRSTIELGRTLGMTTVAEGVECEEEAVLLRRLGVDQLQGWLTGRPMLPEAAMAWLGEHGRRWEPAADDDGHVVAFRPRRAS